MPKKRIRIRFSIIFENHDLFPKVKTNISSIIPEDVQKWQKKMYDFMCRTPLERFSPGTKTEITSSSLFD